MKKTVHIFKASLLIALLAFVIQGCLKDSVTRTFTMYTPVYKTTAEVRASIKNSAPQAIKQPGKMFVMGSYIFLNEVDKGIHIIDNANPSKPVNKYFISIPGNVDLAVKGNTLYADLYSDLVTLDITDPSSVVVKKFIDDAFPFRRYANGFMQDTSKIIVDWITKDTTVSVDYFWNNPRYMTLETSAFSNDNSFSAAKGIAGSMARFTLLNDYLYTVTDNTLNVFNISQQHDPLFSNKVDVGWNIETIYPFKTNLFIGSSSGMFIYGTNNPAQPNLLSAYSHVRSCDPVIAEDDYAYVTLRSGTACAGFTNQLEVLDIKNLLSPVLIKTTQLTNPHGLAKDGDLLFICDGLSGLRVFNAAKPDDLKQLQVVDNIDTYDVIATDNVAIVVAKDGLYQYRYDNASNLKFLSKIGIQKN